MRSVIRALRAEVIKTRRTLAFWLAIIAPLVVISLEVAMFYKNRAIYQNSPPGDEIWFQFGLQTMVLWGLLMMPLFVTLETALVASWEHRNRQWKHLFALPIPRGALYAAKQLCGMALIGLSVLLRVELALDLDPDLGGAPVGEFRGGQRGGHRDDRRRRHRHPE